MRDIKHNVLVSVKSKNRNKLLLRIYSNGINVRNLKYTKDGLEFETSLDNYYKLEYKKGWGK